MLKNKIPRTIYSDIPVKRTKKPSIIPAIIVIAALLAGAYLIYGHFFSSQYDKLAATLFYTRNPLEIKGTEQSIETGGKAKEGDTVQIPFNEDRAIFMIGKDVTLRLKSMTRIKFSVLQRRKKDNQQIIELQLQKGNIWLTTEKPDDIIIVHYPVADIRISDTSQVELKTTVAGSLEILCWEGAVQVIPAIEKEKPFPLGADYRTIIKKSGVMAEPYEINHKDMTVWEAWNLETSKKEIISGLIPTFVEAFKTQRNKLKITGGFTGKITLTPKTLISGKTEFLYWKEVGISGDSKLIFSCREDKIFKSEAGDMYLGMTFRNDGKIDAVNVEAAIEALDPEGKVLGRDQQKIPDLKPGETAELAYKIPQVPDAVNYRVRVLFPQ